MPEITRRSLLRGAALTTAGAGTGLFIAGGRTSAVAVTDPCAPPPPAPPAPGQMTAPTGAVVPSGDRTGKTDCTAAWNDVLSRGLVIDASGNDNPKWLLAGKLKATEGSGVYTGALWDNTTCDVQTNFRGNGATANTSWAKDAGGKLLKPVHGFKITGEGTFGHGPTGSGDLFKLWGDDVELSGFTTPVWRGGRWLMSVGKLWVHDITGFCVPGSSSGAGGARHCGGRGAVFEDSYLWSGDDTWQVVTGGAPNDPMFSQDAFETTFRRLTGKSESGRFLIVALQDANNGSTVLGMTARVEATLFDACHGYGGGSAAVVKNSSSTGPVLDTVFSDSSVDQSQTLDATHGQPAEVYLDKEGTQTGIVDGVDLSGLTILNPRPKKALYGKYGITSDIVNVTPMAA